MAIFAPNHKHIGKTTHVAGTAAAHVRYITRPGAAREVMAEHMPSGRYAAQTWMNQQELTGPKNGRVCDKLMLPLPLELDAEQRADLVREFMHEMGSGRVSWMAAVHDRGKDERNPHAHIILRDKDFETGARVFNTSSKGSTLRIRELWETAINRTLEREGIEARVDRRSLAEQGLAREPGIHVGPNVRAMEERGLRPHSLAQDHTTSRGIDRVVNWPEIDQGRTRADRQREIEAMNREREAERGREKGEQQAEHVPVAMLEPVREIEPPARSLADPERTLERQREPEPTGLVLGGAKVAWHQLEAIQQPSYEVERQPERQQESAPAPEIELERSRMARIVSAARERLTGLAERLEQAFQAIRERQLERQREPQRENATPDLVRGLAKPAAERDPWEVMAEIGRKKREAEPQPQLKREREDWERSLWPDHSKGRERKGPGF